MIFEEKCFPYYTLLINQITFSGCLYFLRYWAIFVFNCLLIGCDVINFEINLTFLIKLFFSAWPKSQDKNLINLRTKRAFKVSEYPQNMEIIKTTFCWIAVLLFEYHEGKMCFFSWNIDIEQNLMLIPCAYILFTEKFILKKIQEHSFFFTWRHRCKKCKIDVTTYRSCLWGAAIQECSLKLIIIRSRQRDVLINNTVLKLRLNSLKNTYGGVQFLLNLHVTLSCF